MCRLDRRIQYSKDRAIHNNRRGVLGRPVKPDDDLPRQISKRL
jgi:hypothetical protein